MQNQNEIRIKPMGEWIKSPYRMDGKYISCHNSDIVGPIYIRYDITRGASAETDDTFYLYIQFPSRVAHEVVDSFEHGIQRAEVHRREFWNNFYAQFSATIMDKED